MHSIAVTFRIINYAACPGVYLQIKIRLVVKMSLPKPIGRQKEVLYLPAQGHLAILGTAGSGKTTLAILRAAYPCQSHDRALWKNAFSDI